jgi:signal transduction histidine kinase
MLDDLLDEQELHNYEIEALQFPEVANQHGLRSAIYVPLDIGQEIIGVMAVYSDRPKGFSKFEKDITVTFAKRLAATYAHVRRIEELSEMERRLNIEAPAIQAGWLAVERVHDVLDNLLIAQSSLSDIALRYRYDRNNIIHKKALEASKGVDMARKELGPLAALAKIYKVSLTRFVLLDLLEEAFDRVRHDAEGNRIRLSITYRAPRKMEVRQDRERLLRVLLNLFNNSIFWLATDSKGGQREINVSVESAGQSVQIRVTDNGPGIAPHDIPKVFEHFYTTKVDKGMGFGLSIGKRLLEDLGGTIRIKSRWGYETEFAIMLPIVARKPITK